MSSSTTPIDVGRVMAAAEAASPLEAVEEVARELGMAFGAVTVSFLIADASGRALVRMAHLPDPDDASSEDRDRELAPGERRREEESATAIPFDGGPAEQAMRTQTVQVVRPSDDTGWRVLAPVTERGECIGLLELYLPDEPDGIVVHEIGTVAHLLAFVVIANRRHTDLYEWGQRSRAYSLSAEIQQRLLPDALTCEAAVFTLAGWLEPAEEIGGDTFDYNLERNVLHLSLTDAMGHGVDAALTATLCMGELRGARRHGKSLLDQAAAANAVLVERVVSASGDDFVTGLVGRVDLRTGVLEIVNAGHVTPYLLRDAGLSTLELSVDLPFGLFADSTYRINRVELQAGDRVVLVTDGMLERNVAAMGLPTVMLDTRHLHPREAVRALADGALAAAGHGLKDDATILCLDWHGPDRASRDAVSGADPNRASDPLPSSRTDAGG